jgi:hypothetical protein
LNFSYYEWGWAYFCKFKGNFYNSSVKSLFMLFAHFSKIFYFLIIVFKVLHVLGMYKHYYSVIYNADIFFLFLKFYLLDCDPSDFHVKF